jgi:16S rRNA (guanine527-N7)-methyltransferase
MGAEEASFAAAYDVSRETLERLHRYEALLKKWNPAINLVSPQTLRDVWTRHFHDSAQIYEMAPTTDATIWADLGAGGGFPGLVIAILAAEKQPGLTVTLVESDQRKAAFLMTVVRELGLRAHILSERIEAISPLGADILSARALAPLPKLLEFAELHLKPGGVALFPKGAKWRDELSEAQKTWRFDVICHASVTDSEATVLKISGVSRV